MHKQCDTITIANLNIIARLAILCVWDRETDKRYSWPSSIRSVHLETHSVVDLVIAQGYMVFVDGIPFLELDLRRICSSLSSDKLLEIAYSVVRAAFDANLSAQTVIRDHLNKSHLGV